MTLTRKTALVPRPYYNDDDDKEESRIFSGNGHPKLSAFGYVKVKCLDIFFLFFFYLRKPILISKMLKVLQHCKTCLWLFKESQ